MNKHIYELATKAGMVMYPTGIGISENTIWGDRNIEKFATLIINSCITQVNDDSAEKIKQQFGDLK